MNAVPHLRRIFVALAVAGASFVSPSRAQDVELEIDAETTSEPDVRTPSDHAPSTADTPDPAAELEALRAAVARLEARLEAVESSAPPADPPTSDAATADGTDAPLPPPPRRWWDALDLRVSGYLQTQLVFSQLSEDELGPDGSPLNQNRFVVRRGRLRVDRHFDYAHVAFEIDASTTRGPFVGIRRAETSFFYPGADEGDVPYVMVTLGLTEVPFGHELREGNRNRWFLERSAGSLAFQRGEPDVGIRVSGGVGPFRYAFAVTNGNPLDDRPGGEPIDLTRAKDLVGRLGVEDESERFRFRAGVSFQSGTGLHPGSPATKPTILWRDTNEDGIIQTVELTGVPGRAATPSIAFDRWGVNADLGFAFHTRLGWTEFAAEATMAQNLDRSYFIADPVATGYDLREVAWYVSVQQAITEYGIVGFRVDHYDPDSDLLDTRRGVRVPNDAGQLTISPMIGAQLPGRGRLVLQYDHIRDRLGRDARGVPIDLRNDLFVARLQMEF